MKLKFEGVCFKGTWGKVNSTGGFLKLLIKEMHTFRHHEGKIDNIPIFIIIRTSCLYGNSVWGITQDIPIE